MNHGGIGILKHSKGTKGLRITFAADILQTLSIEDNSKMSGVFYPGRKETQKSKKTTLDFILSPIPFRLWTKVGRIRVRLLSSDNSIETFSNFLSEQKVSILHSEYSRSGYRFGTWNFVITFDIDVSNDSFDKSKTAYTPTLKSLYDLKDKILKKMNHLLFHDDDDIRFKDSLEIWPITPLAYFYEKSKSLKYDLEDAWLCDSFEVSSSRKDLFFEENHVLMAILGNQIPEDDSELYVYADISTTDVLLRISIIPSRENFRFYNLLVKYTRFQEPDTSRGFCAFITNIIPKHFKIWKLNNYTNDNKPYCEIGGTRLLLEDQRDIPNNVNDIVKWQDKNCEQIEKSIESKEFSLGGKPFKVDATCTAIDYKSIVNELNLQDLKKIYEYDIFLSYSTIDSIKATELCEIMKDSDIDFFKADKSLEGRGGVDFSDEIRDAILVSRKMVLLCTPNSIKSDWVKSEWAAFWVLSKYNKNNIVPVLYQVSMEQLPERLRGKQCIDFADFHIFIKKYCQEIHYKK